MRGIRRPTSITARAAVLLAAGLTLASCSSGPTDFLDFGRSSAPVADAAPVRTPVERQALEKDLAATGARQAADGAASGTNLPPPLALQELRDRQTRDVEALMGAVGSAPAPCRAGETADATGACRPAPAR